MARLAPTPYPLPELVYTNDWKNSPHERAFAALVERSNALPDGEVVGGVIRWQRADGYAHYLVTKASPLTLQAIPYADGYTVEPALIRGLRMSDVLDMLARERRFARR